MAQANGTKSSAEIERELDAQRDKVGARIEEIKQRLSPGQLLDEALAYTKDGGAHFAGNLGQQIQANPIPAALAAIGIGWLMMGNRMGANDELRHSASTGGSNTYDDVDYPYANIGTGGLRRVSHAADDSGDWWSEFETTSGDRYRARSNEHGERMGHFTDKAGKMFSGFIDDTGNRVRDFRDEAGNMMRGTADWANHSWRDAAQTASWGMRAAGSAVRSARDGLMSGGRQLGGTMQDQSDMLMRQVNSLFESQPLIAGALAFAAGAALGATLPHTQQEDELIGEQADKARRQVKKAAGDLYEKGKAGAADLYERGKAGASEVFDSASEAAGELYDETRQRLASGNNGQPLKH
jgi:hypothetical protein